MNVGLTSKATGMYRLYTWAVQTLFLITFNHMKKQRVLICLIYLIKLKSVHKNSIGTKSKLCHIHTVNENIYSYLNY